jgi:hypothetical protein
MFSVNEAEYRIAGGGLFRSAANFAFRSSIGKPRRSSPFSRSKIECVEDNRQADHAHVKSCSNWKDERPLSSNATISAVDHYILNIERGD